MLILHCMRPNASERGSPAQRLARAKGRLRCTRSPKRVAAGCISRTRNVPRRQCRLSHGLLLLRLSCSAIRRSCPTLGCSERLNSTVRHRVQAVPWYRREKRRRDLTIAQESKSP